MAYILIVEDNPIEAREIGCFLSQAGFEIEVCADAERGLERLLTGPFDLLLADLHLPGEDGFALCRRVKGHERLNHVPVVLLTRFADPLNVLRGLEAGADGFISKGQQPCDIVMRLRRVLDRQTNRLAGDEATRDRVVFLQTEFQLDANRDQLLEVLLSGFEDAVSLNERYERQVIENAKVQKSIRDLTILYQSLVETLPLGIMRKDLQGKYTFANVAYCNYAGQSPSDIVGKTDSNFQPRDATQRHEREERAVLDSGRLRDTIECGLNAAGEAVFTQVRRVPLRNSKNQVIGIQGIVWDITDLRRAQDELEALNRSLEERVARRTQELERRNAELEQRNAELDQYAYIASHDLQEPLRKLISFSQLLEKDIGTTLNDAARKDLYYITEAARRMQRLVQDLLAFSRVGRSAMAWGVVHLESCVDRALEALSLRIEETQATIMRTPLPDVQGDATLLTQLYQNLIGNAIKFVRSRPPLVHLTAEPDGEQWILGVQDNGIGIEAQYSLQIFAPFQRLHSRHEYDGTGVGLAICQTAVERHNGRIWVESQPGVGSHFKFTLSDGMGASSVAAPEAVLAASAP